MRIRLHSAGASVAGEHRASNQDSAFVASWGAAVADGVGGGPAGDIASSALLHRLVHDLDGPLTSAQLLMRVREANWDLRAHVEQDRALEGMATTLTGVFTTPGVGLVLAHTGDSRAYRLRAGILTRQTRDDSFVQVLVDRGLMTAEEAAAHPQRNVITASLHGGDEDVVTIAELDARPGDRWLLCSDGVTDYVPEADIGSLVASGTPAEAVQGLVRLAMDAGSRDNVTVVVADVADGDVSPTRLEFLGAAGAPSGIRLESA